MNLPLTCDMNTESSMEGGRFSDSSKSIIRFFSFLSTDCIGIFSDALGLAICRVLGREDLLLFLEGDLILFRETLEGFGVLLAFSFDLMVSCWDTNNRDDLRTLPLLLLELGVFWFI